MERDQPHRLESAGAGQGLVVAGGARQPDLDDHGHRRGAFVAALCFDLRTGAALHDVELFTPEKLPNIHSTNSFASPTPILEPGSVYVHFGTFGTACLDTQTGAIRWKNEELKLEHEVGPGSSPVLYKDRLLLNCDGTDVQFAAALDKRSGNILWKVPRSVTLVTTPNRKKAFVTPTIIRRGGHDEAIMPGAEYCYAYDPMSGRELWRLHYPGYSNVPRPLFAHGLLFLGTGYDTPEFWAVRPNGSGELSESAVVWKVTKGASTKPSAAVVGEEVYLLSDAGVLTCLERRDRQGTFSPSAVGQVFGLAGDCGRANLFLRRERPDHRDRPRHRVWELAANRLDGQFMASPAVVGKALILRTDTHRIGSKSGRGQ